MFKFSLAAVLRLNEQFEEQAKNKLGQASRRLREETAALHSVEQEIAALYDHFRTAGFSNSGELLYFHNYSCLLGDNRKKQQMVVEKCTAEVSRARLELITCKHEVQKLQRLREKKLREYNLDEQRREQKTLDEIAAGRYIKNSRLARREFH